MSAPAEPSPPNRAVIGVGSNVEPERHIAAARRLVALGARLLGESDWVVTAPVGPAGQPDFVNGAFLIATALERAALVEWLHRIESELGRVRSGDRYAPRSIDLDLAVWNGEIVDPDVRERAYLRRAVRQLLPGLL